MKRKAKNIPPNSQSAETSIANSQRRMKLTGCDNGGHQQPAKVIIWSNALGATAQSEYGKDFPTATETISTLCIRWFGKARNEQTI